MREASRKVIFERSPPQIYRGTREIEAFKQSNRSSSSLDLSEKAKSSDEGLN